MKQLVEYIVSNLVNHPEDVVIEEIKSTEEEDSSSIIIQVNPEDVGRVIGRAGKVINSIRQIARIAAIQKGVRVRVDLKEDDQPQPQPKADEPMAQEAPAEPVEETPAKPVKKKATEKPVEEKAPEEAPTL